MPRALHEEIDATLRRVIEEESWYGNNILSRVPQMHQVLNCPVVRDAVASIAGPDYYLHPHRAVHSSTPVGEVDAALTAETNAPPMGKGSRAGSGWHQDAQSPLSRARHHLPRYLIGFYFPHHTPVAMGADAHPGRQPPLRPSGRALRRDSGRRAGRHVLSAALRHGPRRLSQPHAARLRYMVKFVFARTRHADAPAWRNVEADWRKPKHCLAEYDAPAAWRHVWHWMRGAPAARAARSASSSAEMAGFDSADQATRLQSIYRAAECGDVPALVDALLAHAGKDRHERALAVDESGRSIPRDDIRGWPRRWNERAVVMEDAAYCAGGMRRRCRSGPRSAARQRRPVDADQRRPSRSAKSGLPRSAPRRGWPPRSTIRTAKWRAKRSMRWAQSASRLRQRCRRSNAC